MLGSDCYFWTNLDSSTVLMASQVAIYEGGAGLAWFEFKERGTWIVMIAGRALGRYTTGRYLSASHLQSQIQDILCLACG